MAYDDSMDTRQFSAAPPASVAAIYHWLSRNRRFMGRGRGGAQIEDGPMQTGPIPMGPLAPMASAYQQTPTLGTGFDQDTPPQPPPMMQPLQKGPMASDEDNVRDMLMQRYHTAAPQKPVLTSKQALNHYLSKQAAPFRRPRPNVLPSRQHRPGARVF